MEPPNILLFQYRFSTTRGRYGQWYGLGQTLPPGLWPGIWFGTYPTTRGMARDMVWDPPYHQGYGGSAVKRT